MDYDMTLDEAIEIHSEIQDIVQLILVNLQGIRDFKKEEFEPLHEVDELIAQIEEDFDL